MSNQINLFEPLINSLFEVGKVIARLVRGDKFDFVEYFKIIEFCNNQGVYPKLIKEYKGLKGDVYLFSIPTGLGLKEFEKQKGGIVAALGIDIDIRLVGKYIEIEVITNTVPTKIDYRLQDRIKDSICISFAQSLEGQVYLDLKETPHTLCTGTTGGGKSVTTRNIITSIINLYPNEVDLHLIDFKVVELSIFKKLEQTRSYVNELEEAKEIIADRLEECKRRYNLFDELGVTNIYDYNKKVSHDKKLKFEFIVIEEFVMLLEDKKKIAMINLKKLASLSRASGQFLYITAQRFDNTIIDLVLRSVIGNRICHLVESENDSKLIIDITGAEKLRGNGHILFKNGSKVTECQSYFITDNQIRDYTKKYINHNKQYEPIEANVSDFKKLNDKVIEEVKEAKENRNNKVIDLSFIDNL